MDIPILLTLLTIMCVFIAFFRGWAEVELVALFGAAFLLVTGILTTDDFASVLSNQAALTVGAMFIVSAALEKTGLIDLIGRTTVTLSKKNVPLTVCLLFSLVLFTSFFINNTSVVLIMIPVVAMLAHNLKTPSSKFLIPLSYVSIFGGTCTLIGTSTNLLVDAGVRGSGLSGFTMFELTSAGLIMAAVGVIYLVLVGRRILPDRESLGESFEKNFTRQFLTQIYVNEGSPLIGKTITEAGFTEGKGFEPLQLVRKDIGADKKSKFLNRKDLAKLVRARINSKDSDEEVIQTDTFLQAGDRLVVLTSQREVLALSTVEDSEGKKEKIVTSLSSADISSDETVVMEGIVGPNSHFSGKYLKDINFSNYYNVSILGVHRQKGRISKDFENILLSVGDTVLLKGNLDDLKKIFDNDELINLTEPELQPFRRRKAPIAMAALVGAVGLATFDIIPIAGAVFIAAIAVLASGCLKMEDAYRSLQGNVLLLIYGMLALSIAMEKTGAMQLIVDIILSLTAGAPPIVILAIIYLLASVLTELVSNNATAVMLTPIVITLAQEMGVDPRPFAVAIMFAASASFATPIGYQTNTLVFNAGGYQFTDFLRIGLPLNLLMWITAIIVIPMFWPL